MTCALGTVLGVAILFGLVVFGLVWWLLGDEG